jgi:hypothetical protein
MRANHNDPEADLHIRSAVPKGNQIKDPGTVVDQGKASGGPD